MSSYIAEVERMIDGVGYKDKRIEELESEVTQWHSEAMSWIEKWGAAEAKLAKAVEALRFYADGMLARAVLAELEAKDE